jgi:hypothetical protein
MKASGPALAVKSLEGARRSLMQKKPQFSTLRDPLSMEGEERKGQTRVLSTRDHDVIRGWAVRHGAEPATGEATSSGPATVTVNDGGAGVRFNFPSAARFRPISWEEWFANFDDHVLTFVYEEEVADRAYELFEARGGDHGRDQEDWFAAERALQKPGIPSARYRLIKE